jgi:hypothetical protein
MAQLYQWQLRTIHQLGIDGFNTFSTERMASGLFLNEFHINFNLFIGRVFHSVVQDLLEELIATGKIESTAKDALLKLKTGEKYVDTLVGYLSGIREYLCELKVNPLIRLEKSTFHPILSYTGRFDAIVEIG